MYSAHGFIPALTLVASGARESDHHQISPGGGHRFIIHTSFITDARRDRRGRAPLRRLRVDAAKHSCAAGQAA